MQPRVHWCRWAQVPACAGTICAPGLHTPFVGRPAQCAWHSLAGVAAVWDYKGTCRCGWVEDPSSMVDGSIRGPSRAPTSSRATLCRYGLSSVDPYIHTQVSTYVDYLSRYLHVCLQHLHASCLRDLKSVAIFSSQQRGLPPLPLARTPGKKAAPGGPPALQLQ